MIIVESRWKKPETILKKYPDAILVDVTSHATTQLVKLSPFYPHGEYQFLRLFCHKESDSSFFACQRHASPVTPHKRT